uniref:Protein krueppel n=1 Tax=Anopheles minimus TaxID=112268 RepID=A0A182WF14_9DIPT
MNAFHTVSTMCRFCLSKNQDQLLAVTAVLDSALTIDTIQLFTGVQLTTSNIIPYAICGSCKDILQASIEFRNICLSNDAHFKRSLAINTSEKKDESRLQPQRSETELLQVEIMLPDENTEHHNDTFDTLASESESEHTAEEPIEEMVSNSNERVACSSSTDDMEFKTRYVLNDELDEKNRDYMVECPKLDNEEQNHVHQSQEKAGNSSTKRKWQLCVTCGKLVKNLWYHIGTHANNNASYACPHCPMKMKNQSNLARHIQAVHLKRVVKSCEPCGRGFSHINSYKAHMRSRHGVGETYQCELCLKTFKQPSGYKKHVSQAHNNERNFVCSVCDKPFKDKQALNLHKNVHSTARPFACGMCPKQFKGASAKRAHELTHIGVIFKCTLCDKSYQYKSLLNLHVKKHHPAGV